jgi:hypothetical protein
MPFHTKSAPRFTTRDVEPNLRRARLLAARKVGIVSPLRRGILSGHCDRGIIVRQWLEGEGGR